LIILFALIGIGLLLFGIAEVWNGRWRAMCGALGYTAAFAVICFTAELWFPYLGMSRGDGFILIGYFMFGLGALAAALGTLAIALPIHFIRKRDRAAARAL